MTFDLSRVVVADLRKNYEGRGFDRASVQLAFEEYIRRGLPYFCVDSVLIVYNVADDAVEFHCVNGGTGADLTAAINDFLTVQSSNFDRAVTYYDNPRINELIKFSKFPAQVKRIDGGEDRTYEMSFDLRGM